MLPADALHLAIIAMNQTKNWINQENMLVKDLINMVIYVYDYFDFCYFMSLFVFVVVFW
jgi:hypothetical protein